MWNLHLSGTKTDTFTFSTVVVVEYFTIGLFYPLTKQHTTIIK